MFSYGIVKFLFDLLNSSVNFVFQSNSLRVVDPQQFDKSIRVIKPQTNKKWTFHLFMHSDLRALPNKL